MYAFIVYDFFLYSIIVVLIQNKNCYKEKEYFSFL